MRGFAAPFVFVCLLTLSGCAPPGQLGAIVQASSASTHPAVTPPVVAASGPRLRLVALARALERPVWVGAPPGDSRIFVLEQVGRVRVIENGALLPTPFLDISSQVASRASERGLLGLAFHPRFAENGRFFLNYTHKSNGATVVAEYRQDPAQPTRALPEAREILRVGQPYANHNAGMLAFGPRDGYLYIGLGDGGLGGDPQGHGQNPRTLLGSMLRVGVDGEEPYSIPSTNPFVGQRDIRPEIWATGLRNPWRYTFDRVTGDLWIADVGQNTWEEIHVQPAASRGGENYGWATTEGMHCFRSPLCDTEGLEQPLLEYNHDEGCSITGGYVYRGAAIPQLVGHFFYGDWCRSWVRSVKRGGTAGPEHFDWTEQFDTGSEPLPNGIATFGEDAAGELLLTDHRGGRVLRLERQP